MLTRKKPQSMIPFEGNKNAALYYDGDRGKFVLVEKYRRCEDSTMYSYESENSYYNPLEALTLYEETLSPGLRPRFGDWLESIGYQRYSGKPLGFEASPLPQNFHRAGAHCSNCRYGVNGSATCPERYNKVLCANGIPIDPGKEE